MSRADVRAALLPCPVNADPATRSVSPCGNGWAARRESLGSTLPQNSAKAVAHGKATPGWVDSIVELSQG